MLILNPKAAKKKPQLENNAIEVSTKQIEMQSYADAFKAMQETIKSQEDRNRELFELNSKMQEEVNELKSDFMQCSNALCVNSLCPLREPERGLGDELFKLCKRDNKSLFNNRDFQEIALEKGYEIKKIKSPTNK